jgi:cytosine/adenosine deaminase-related metal-dependent hydrolase
MGRILIRGGTIVSNDSKIGELRRGDLLIEGTKIAAIAPRLDAGDAEVIDATDMMVLPGFVDSHRHTWQSLLRADEAGIALREGRELDPIPLTSREVFEFATVEGARACGLLDRIGTLTPGKEADVILLDTNAPNMMPLNYSYGAIVENAHAGNVDSVFVAGRAMKRHGKLVGVNLRDIRRNIDAARDGLFERAGLAHDEHWMPKPYLKAEVDAEF